MAKAKAVAKKKPAAKKRLPARRSGVVPDLAASAEPLSIYAGNSARMDDVDEAERAYERAEAWAQAPAGTKYGEGKR
jgi:hypothetical protein